MPKIHLYIRDQFTTDDAGATQVASAVEALQKAVEGEGGSLRGSCTIEPDEAAPTEPTEPEPPPEPPPTLVRDGRKEDSRKPEAEAGREGRG